MLVAVFPAHLFAFAVGPSADGFAHVLRDVRRAHPLCGAMPETMIRRKIAPVLLVDDTNLGKPRPHTLASVVRSAGKQRPFDDLGQVGQEISRKRNTAARHALVSPDYAITNAL